MPLIVENDPGNAELFIEMAPGNEVFHVADRPYGLIEGTVLAPGVAADEGDW